MASIFSSVLLALSLLSSPFLSNANAHTKLGFSADLIHRDSPKSPFYNPTETSAERLRNAVQRSVNRVAHFNGKDAYGVNSPQTEITSYGGEFLMNVSLGTPPFPIMAIADTGSDLLWTQCKPCDDCYAQDDPLFDPKASSTYKDVSCSSKQCTALENQASCSTEDNKTCSYTLSYGDKSYTKGNVAADTLTLGSTDNRPVQLKNIVIGCGHNNAGTFSKKGSGIVGLGGGSVSLISQLGDSIDGKFSYCLVPLSSNDTTSKINFGTNAVVSGNGSVSTPLITKSQATFYYLTLESVSVGSKNIKYPLASDSESGKGNIIIDSGTTLTIFTTEFYAELEDAVASSIDAERVNDPQNVLSLCYSATAKPKFPVITMHFDGADVKLDSSNAFIQISEDLVCFAFRGDDQLAIYGNIAQMNFLVGYDTVSETVSFKSADCAKM
ncbi:hypothetical protein N665_0355s0018 [Sinapis alba]|nr:hypothetical protein N665_0355s0018 [Sinapis alba]